MSPLRPGLVLREARDDELAALAELAQHCFGPAWSRAALAAERAAGAWLGVVCEAGAAPLGLVLAASVLDEAELRLLAVAPAARRRGLARALVRATLSQLAARGARRVHLEVRAGNAAALALYASEGFAQVGSRPRYYPGGEAAVLLARALRPEVAA